MLEFFLTCKVTLSIVLCIEFDTLGTFKKNPIWKSLEKICSGHKKGRLDKSVDNFRKVRYLIARIEVKQKRSEGK